MHKPDSREQPVRAGAAMPTLRRRATVWTGLVLGVLMTHAASGAATVPATTTPAAASPATTATRRTIEDRTVDARQKFLAVERFARLAPDDQAKALSAFYRDVAPQTLNEMTISALSSFPVNILDLRQGVDFPRGDIYQRYAEQLAAAVPQMTPEKAADILGTTADNRPTPMWLNVAAYVRTRQAFQAQAKPVAALIDADLDSPDVTAFKRGCQMARELNLTRYYEKILEVYIPDGPRAEAAYTALILWCGDAGGRRLAEPAKTALMKRLRGEVVKDPRTIIRHAGMLQMWVSGKQADPDIARLLSSNDADVRYYAAYALMSCKDDGLAKPIASLAQDQAPRTQALALLMAATLSDDAFAAIRKNLVGLLKSKELIVRNASLKAFAAHRDAAVAPLLREFLTAPDPPTNVPGQSFMFSVQADGLRSALRALTGTDFGFDPRNWGSQKNATAITQFDAWVRQHAAPAEPPDLP